jgi:hypothetical protein
MRWIRELSENHLPLRSGFVSIQRLQGGKCHPSAPAGVLPNPFINHPSTIRRESNTGGGN